MVRDRPSSGALDDTLTGEFPSDFVGEEAGVELQDSGVTVKSPAKKLSADEALVAFGISSSVGGIDVDHDSLFSAHSGFNQLANGDQLIVGRTAIDDGEQFKVYECSLTQGAGKASPTDCDLELVTIASDNTFTTRTVLIDSDGATINAEVTGSPIGRYENNTGATQTTGVLVNNQSGGPIDVQAHANAVVV